MDRPSKSGSWWFCFSPKWTRLGLASVWKQTDLCKLSVEKVPITKEMENVVFFSPSVKVVWGKPSQPKLTASADITATLFQAVWSGFRLCLVLTVLCLRKKNYCRDHVMGFSAQSKWVCGQSWCGIKVLHTNIGDLFICLTLYIQRCSQWHLNNSRLYRNAQFILHGDCPCLV